MATSPFSVMAKSYTTDVVNGISTGDIHISINEYEHDKNGNLVSYVDHKTVLPGQTIDKIIRITNDANPAWIRAKLEYTDCGEFAGLSDEDIVLSSDKWKKCGEYYYYTEPVGSKANVDFIKSVCIPSSWDESRSDNDFSIYTSVDAVQTANFTPDFSTNDPWFGTVIEECVHTEHDSKLNMSDKPFSVIFEGGAKGIVKTEDDFFQNWASLMPGDTVSDDVKIGNRYGRTVYIYFKADPVENKELLSNLHLTIKNGNAVVFDDTMDKAMEKYVYLGGYAKNESGTLTYTVSVPKELTNKHALSSAKTAWHFQCVLASRTGTPGIDFNAPGPEPGPEPSYSKTETVITPSEPQIDKTAEPRKNPKTGDDSQLMLYLSSMGFFGCAAAMMVILSKKKKKEKETKESGS